MHTDSIAAYLRQNDQLITGMIILVWNVTKLHIPMDAVKFVVSLLMTLL